jgi:hypothetical protein
MKNQTPPNFLIRSSLALAAVLAIWTPVRAEMAAPAEGKNMMEGKMMDRCQEMKEQNNKMMAEMKAQDAELAAQVAAMNSAPDSQKLALVTAIVTHLVEQRTAMNTQKAKMEDEMMKHMMRHMQMGKDSISQCPMMKEMKDMGEKSTDAHPEHHEEKK